MKVSPHRRRKPPPPTTKDPDRITGPQPSIEVLTPPADVLSSPGALATTDPDDPAEVTATDGVHQHDGLMVSLFLGGGITVAPAIMGKGTMEPPTGMLTIAIGYSVSQSIAIHAELLTGFPQIVAGGIGARIYLPMNFFINPSIGGGLPGAPYGKKLMLGKEWWVSDEWAIGLALTGIGSTAGTEDDFISWDSSVTVALGFTATFN